MGNLIKIRAVSAPWHRGIEFLLTAPLDEHNIGIGKLEFETTQMNFVERPTFSLSMDEAQTLMDDLWNCGIRPTEKIDNPGELRATKYHLEDTRKLVDKLLPRVLE